MLFVTTFSTPTIFLEQAENASEFSICIFTQCVKLLSKSLEVNFKRLYGIELLSNVTFLVLSYVNNHLFIYAFATSVDCEIRYAGTAELNYNQYICARVTCTINFSDRET